MLGDIRAELPLGITIQYDLVASFFCVEPASNTKEEWKQNMRRLTSLIEPGGTLVLAAVKDCTSYQVLNTVFPVVPIGPPDFLELLPQLEFEPTSLDVRSVPIHQWTEEGFSAICLVYGVKESWRKDNREHDEQAYIGGGGVRTVPGS